MVVFEKKRGHTVMKTSVIDDLVVGFLCYCSDLLNFVIITCFGIFPGFTVFLFV